MRCFSVGRKRIDTDSLPEIRARSREDGWFLESLELLLVLFAFWDHFHVSVSFIKCIHLRWCRVLLVGVRCGVCYVASLLIGKGLALADFPRTRPVLGKTAGVVGFLLVLGYGL